MRVTERTGASDAATGKMFSADGGRTWELNLIVNETLTQAP
jgi:hypothetical protein